MVFISSIKRTVIQFVLRKKWNKKNKSIIVRGAQIDKHTVLGERAYLGKGYYCGSKIGDYSYVASGFLPLCKIGRFTSIGPQVEVISGSHPLNRVSTSPAFIKDSICAMKGRIAGLMFQEQAKTENGFFAEIGNDVWIGAHVLIKEGIKIGDGSVIGMGAVVIKDVPPYSIVGGVPARVIRYRFDNSTIERLLKSEWWNLPKEKLSKLANFFESPDIFLNEYGKS